MTVKRQMVVRDVLLLIEKIGKCHAKNVKERAKIIGGGRKNEKRYHHRKKNKTRRNLLDQSESLPRDRTARTEGQPPCRYRKQ